MNQPILSKSDINSLYQIVDEANKAYLKQSHLCDKTAFNILRVLAALRLLYHQSPPALYNAVLFITKNYNPQTYYHWKKAIEDLNRNRSALFKSKSNYCRPQIATYTKTYQNSFNRSRINESEHLQSKSYAQINIPQQINCSKQESFDDEEQKIASQTNAETGKRQYFTKADSISHVSKNHYISFEPYRHSIDNFRNHYYDKENINSTNVEESRKRQSAYQYIEAIQRDLNRTAKNSQIKTPIDQSFIKNINNSESPFLYTKIPQEVLDPIEEQIRTRANTFYRFNLRLKAFSSLQANSYVFLKAKENQMKAKLQYHSKLLQISFLSLKNNVIISNLVKEKQQKADKFCKNNLQRKVFNILKLVFDLRINADKIKIPNVTQYNKMNYQFVLNLLFVLNRSSQDEKLSFIDFENKIIELIHSDEANKLYLIVKYFGKYSWATQKNIQNLIDLYKQRICRQAFRGIRAQRQRNIKYLSIRQANLKKQSFYALKIRWNRFACYNNKIKSAQSKRNRKLLEKVMKSMLQTVYSTKLYSKRCEYIQRKHLFHLKTITYKLWLERAKIKMENKNKLISKSMKVIQHIQWFIKKIVLKKINHEIKQVEQKAKNVINTNIELRKIEWFKSLKINLVNSNKLKEFERLMEKNRCAMAVVKWKQCTKKGKAITKITNIIKAYYFRKLVLPNFEESIEIIKNIQYTQLDLQRKTFKAFKRFFAEQKKIREGYAQVFKRKAIFMRKSIALLFFKQDFIIQKAKKERDIIRQKSGQILSQRKLLNEQRFIDMFLKMHDQKIENNKRQNGLINKLYISVSMRFLNKLREMSSLKMNASKLNSIFMKNKAKKTASNLLEFICHSKIKKIKQIRRQNASHSLSMTLKNIYHKQCKKKQLSNQFRNTYLCKKVFDNLFLLVNQSYQVAQVAKHLHSKKNWDIIKDSLSYCMKMNKVSQLHRKNQIRKGFGNIIKQKLLKNCKQELQDWRVANLRQQLIRKMQYSRNLKAQKKLRTQKILYFNKWQGITRLQSFYIEKLISNKHLYMALKFRAFKLCLNSFRVLASKQPRRRPIGMVHKGLAERLSTDIAE